MERAERRCEALNARSQYRRATRVTPKGAAAGGDPQQPHKSLTLPRRRQGTDVFPATSHEVAASPVSPADGQRCLGDGLRS